MALYESTFIANQELTNKQLDELVHNFSDFLKHNNAKLVKKEYWGVKNFSYAINKQKKGHYTMLCIDCPAENIDKLAEKMKYQEEILKYYCIKVDEFSKEDSNLVKHKED